MIVADCNNCTQQIASKNLNQKRKVTKIDVYNLQFFRLTKSSEQAFSLTKGTPPLIWIKCVLSAMRVKADCFEVLTGPCLIRRIRGVHGRHATWVVKKHAELRPLLQQSSPICGLFVWRDISNGFVKPVDTPLHRLRCPQRRSAKHLNIWPQVPRIRSFTESDSFRTDPFSKGSVLCLLFFKN